ncbi:GUN4 N-terminal ARM-like repeat domain-containing protein [Leptolyngbya sp. CCNP1308]|uniref:GUN4 N-terminal ARM-like repeat domain-containing protein n=1 Tax=Leptolyngbya sp. CCNP1308 TaxID=3110255 RepID=UPI002B1F6948|nr:GUN4 N-terminal ARM-like repeat domain-containing protein [Leptolyngbya sp. CCNP1308]MEA5452005.1 GUN4 N-terminal ARM-like repeat domain-containing protein [Leptolyngbya sp. CCNP1308]
MVSDIDTLVDLRAQLRGDSLKKQLSAVHELLALGQAGLEALTATLVERKDEQPTILDGKIFQVLYATGQDDLRGLLTQHWPQGRLEMPSAQGVDYGPLQDLLIQQDFEAADRLTLAKLCELAGPTAVKRKWVYFTEVEQFPVVDLHTIDRLWLDYSEGKFGFSVQRRIWLSLGKNWDKFWPRIAWKDDNIWTRYPGGFIWDLSAPDGHLPLSNQLRGVRMMASLLTHPAWSEEG